MGDAKQASQAQAAAKEKNKRAQQLFRERQKKKVSDLQLQLAEALQQAKHECTARQELQEQHSKLSERHDATVRELRQLQAELAACKQDASTECTSTVGKGADGFAANPNAASARISAPHRAQLVSGPLQGEEATAAGSDVATILQRPAAHLSPGPQYVDLLKKRCMDMPTIRAALAKYTALHAQSQSLAATQARVGGARSLADARLAPSLPSDTARARVEAEMQNILEEVGVYQRVSIDTGIEHFKASPLMAISMFTDPKLNCYAGYTAEEGATAAHRIVDAMDMCEAEVTTLLQLRERTVAAYNGLDTLYAAMLKQMQALASPAQQAVRFTANFQIEHEFMATVAATDALQRLCRSRSELLYSAAGKFSKALRPLNWLRFQAAVHSPEDSRATVAPSVWTILHDLQQRHNAIHSVADTAGTPSAASRSGGKRARSATEDSARTAPGVDDAAARESPRVPAAAAKLIQLSAECVRRCGGDADPTPSQGTRAAEGQAGPQAAQGQERPQAQAQSCAQPHAQPAAAGRDPNIASMLQALQTVGVQYAALGNPAARDARALGPLLPAQLHGPPAAPPLWQGASQLPALHQGPQMQHPVARTVPDQLPTGSVEAVPAPAPVPAPSQADLDSSLVDLAIEWLQLAAAPAVTPGHDALAGQQGRPE